MKKQNILNKMVILAVLAFIVITLPGQLGKFALAQQETSLMFIENVGQFTGNEQQARFQVNAGSVTIRLTDEALWLTIIESTPIDSSLEEDVDNDPLESEIEARQGVNLKLSFADANPQPHLEPFNRLSTRVSYFTGDDPANWQTDVPVWGGVRYVDLYPGVDLEVTGENGRLAQRLIVRKSDGVTVQNVDTLQQVQWQVEGADEVSVEGGRLRLSTALGDFTLPLLQIVNDDNLPVELSTAQAEVDGFAVTAPFAPAFKTELDEQPLAMAGVSDLLYSTFLGGEGTFDNGYGITFDTAGHAYVTGQADPGFPTTPGAFDTTIDGVYNDVFVVKLNPDGSDLVYATFVGGSDWEISNDIYVDEAGNALITGHTTSPDFPITSGAFDDTMAGTADAYVVKLNDTGTELLYSTFFGGNENDYAYALAVDGAGNAYVTGTTGSDDFPITPDAFDSIYQPSEAYVIKMNPDGSDLVYATYLGGEEFESGYGIAVDELGSAYVAGRTSSPDFPVTPGAFDTAYNYYDGFVVKLTPDGAGLVYGTFIGGSEYDNIQAIDIDPAGNAYLTGDTRSADFPTTPDAFAPTCSHCPSIHVIPDSFVSKLAADGSALIYSSFLGGELPDDALDIAVSANGRAYVTGYTYSADFPTTPDAFDPICDSCGESYSRADAFVVRINPAGTVLEYGTFLGGDGGSDRGVAVAADDDGHVYVTGSTDSDNFPITEGAFDTTREGFYDVFVSKLATGSDDPEVEPTPTPTPAVPEHTCGPTPLGEVTVGDTPRGLAVDSTRNRVYVANFGGHSVSVIDTTTNTVLETITGIESATGVAYDPTNNIIWVTSFSLDQVIPIQANEDATGFTVLSGINVGDGPWGVVYQPLNNYVYVVNNLSESVSVIDAGTKEVVATITEPFHSPWHLAANSVTGKVYVANAGHNSVTVINGTSISSEVQIWDSGSAYGIAVDETRDTVYVATVHAHRIVAIGWLNGLPDQFLGWASFQRGYNRNRPIPLRAIAVNPQIGPSFDGGHLWATTSTGDGSEFNQALFIPKGWSSRFHVPLPHNLGVEPTEGIAVDRINNRVYFTSGGTPGTVTVIGDHANICSGIAPAMVEDETDINDEIGLDVYSVAEVTRSDVISDGLIDIFDLVFVAARYDSDDPTADLNDDGTVDILDLVIVANNYDRYLPGVRQ